MKDASHHINHVQRKVIQSNRKTAILAVMESGEDQHILPIQPKKRVFRRRRSKS